MLFVCFSSLVIWEGYFSAVPARHGVYCLDLPVVPGLDVEQYGTMQYVLIL